MELRHESIGYIYDKVRYAYNGALRENTYPSASCQEAQIRLFRLSQTNSVAQQLVGDMRKRHRSSTLASRLRPRIFIGSSVEGLEVAKAIQSALYYEAEPVIWSQGVFGLSGGTLESLVEECGNFDFAVFILSADDLVIKKKQKGNAPRDNVLFELGLFMGRLGRERTFFVHCKDDELLLPTDLAGVTSASYLPPSEPRYIHAALSAAVSPILAAAHTLGPRAARGIPTSSLPSELDELRGQVAEMRIALSSFAAYAQKLPSREASSVNVSAESANGEGLKVLLGTWKADPTGSTAWCAFVGGRQRFLYCYGDDGEPTGEYYDWKRTGNTLSGKFRWFKQEDIRGYGWFEIVGEDRLRGGWWMHGDVPGRLASKLPHVPNMVPLEWQKVSAKVAAKAKSFLLKLQ